VIPKDRNPSFILTTSEVDRIIDLIDKRKTVTAIQAWQTNLNNYDRLSHYITARWGYKTYSGHSRRTSNLWNKIRKACGQLDKNNPDIVWSVSAYGHGTLCFIAGCDRTSARQMAWSLYSWLLPESWVKSNSASSLETEMVGVGGKLEVLRRMTSMIQTYEDKVKTSERYAREKIAEARALRTRVEAVKRNLLCDIDLSFPGVSDGDTANP
jgi:hypothetical protein